MDTIIAQATGETYPSAIGIIRISGFEKLSDFSPFLSLNIKKIVPRKMYLCNVLNFFNKKEIFDSVLICYFQAPQSYTGENMLEIYPHGNPKNIQRIISNVIHAGFARYAKEGEFSARAFLNKKITFLQLEGLNKLIYSKSYFELSQSVKALNGELDNIVSILYKKFLEIKAFLELCIDFEGDTDFFEIKKNFLVKISDYSYLLNDLLNKAKINKDFLKIPEVVLIGPSNAGKSSFFNSILKYNRALVSPIPGTTRDYISEKISIAHFDITLVDTAGIRDTDDILEKTGIDESLKKSKNAFYKILLCPLNQNFKNIEKIMTLFLDSANISLPNIILFTFCDEIHKDLLKEWQLLAYFFKKLIDLNQKIICFFSVTSKNQCLGFMTIQNGSIEPFFILNTIDVFEEFFKKIITFIIGSIEPNIKIGKINEDINKESSLNAFIFKELEKTLSALYEKNETPFLNDRHLFLLEEIIMALKKSEEVLNDEDFALVDYLLGQIEKNFQEFFGVIDKESVLNYIFSNFCIGK